MPYRLNAKTLFLTYPQCDLTKEQVRDYFIDFFGDHLKQYIVAHELHATGDSHIHCYLRLDGPIDTTVPTYLDVLGHHGNYQGCRSPKNVIKYCTKEEDYCSNIDVGEYLDKGKGGKRKQAMKEIIEENKSLEELIPKYPELLFGYKRLKEDVSQYRRDCSSHKEHVPTFLPNPWGWVLFSKRHAKQRHYWIFSRQPNKGKTFHFAKPLAETYRCAIKSGDFTYWNLRGDEEIIILDEYNSAGVKYAILNSMCDGSFEYRIFQGGLLALNNPLIVVLSNQPINEIYPFMNALLYARFIEKEIL